MQSTLEEMILLCAAHGCTAAFMVDFGEHVESTGNPRHYGQVGGSARDVLVLTRGFQEALVVGLTIESAKNGNAAIPIKQEDIDKVQ